MREDRFLVTFGGLISSLPVPVIGDGPIWTGKERQPAKSKGSLQTYRVPWKEIHLDLTLIVCSFGHTVAEVT